MSCVKTSCPQIAYVAQHHIEQLASHLESTAVAYFCDTHKTSETAARQALGGFGLVGNLALQRIGTLSGGQKARLTFATMLHDAPHLMILDEPTNHLDKDSLDSLSAAIKLFKGAVIMVSWGISMAF
jgi:ATP-binding cassette subfamily F protein 3